VSAAEGFNWVEPHQPRKLGGSMESDDVEQLYRRENGSMAAGIAPKKSKYSRDAKQCLAMICNIRYRRKLAITVTDITYRGPLYSLDFEYIHRHAMFSDFSDRAVSLHCVGNYYKGYFNKSGLSGITRSFLFSSLKASRSASRL
jgi:hypothetical protein